MANQTDIEAYYDSFGALHALRMEPIQGAYPDYTCAFFDGDYTKSYVRAQSDKYDWVLSGLGFTGDLHAIRILDIGCGWGPMLNAVRMRGGSAVGLTLSPGQARHGSAHGLDVRLRDYKHVSPETLGHFDGIVSIGAFEHFCSISEKKNGGQEAIYRDFFERCAAMLPKGGRLFLQTMTWGERVPDWRTLSLRAPLHTPEAILARMEYMYPGSWLPDGLLSIIECASPYFDFMESRNGRLDYLETLRHWGMATKNLWKRALITRTFRIALPLALEVFTDRATRIRLRAILKKDQEECFRRGIMSHERMFFVKK